MESRLKAVASAPCAKLGGREPVAEADGRLLGFMSLAEGGYIDFAYIRAEARGAGLLLRETVKRFGNVDP